MLCSKLHFQNLNSIHFSYKIGVAPVLVAAGLELRGGDGERRLEHVDHQVRHLLIASRFTD